MRSATRFITAMATAALLAAAAPSLSIAQSVSVDVQRSGGLPTLDANGDWVWQVFYNTDADGGAAGIELGANFTDADLISGSVTTAGIGGGDVEEAIPGQVIFGWETLSSGLGGNFPVGLQVDPSQGTNGQAFYSFGTGILDGDSSLLLVTFTTQGPSVGGTLTSTIDILGAYDSMANLVPTGTGTHGIVGQSSGSTAVSAFGSITALLGDVNLDGVVDAADLAIVDMNLGQTLTGGWAVGDLDRSGQVDAGDRQAVQSRVPEPTTFGLLALAVLGLMGRLRRR